MDSSKVAVTAQFATGFAAPELLGAGIMDSVAIALLIGSLSTAINQHGIPFLITFLKSWQAGRNTKNK